MMPSIYKTFSLLALTALAAATPCQEKKTSRAEARAEARADAGGSGDKRSSHSVTHRVVVVNGKKIVDERTENGRPVGSGRVGSGRPPLPGKPAVPDADELLRRMREQLERDLGRKLPLGGFGEPLPKQGSSSARKTARAETSPRKPTRRAKPARGRLEPRRKLR